MVVWPIKRRPPDRCLVPSATAILGALAILRGGALSAQDSHGRPARSGKYARVPALGGEHQRRSPWLGGVKQELCACPGCCPCPSIHHPMTSGGSNADTQGFSAQVNGSDSRAVALWGGK